MRAETAAEGSRAAVSGADIHHHVGRPHRKAGHQLPARLVVPTAQHRVVQPQHVGVDLVHDEIDHTTALAAATRDAPPRI